MIKIATRHVSLSYDMSDVGENLKMRVQDLLDVQSDGFFAHSSETDEDVSAIICFLPSER